jgi:hypothetical protein
MAMALQALMEVMDRAASRTHQNRLPRQQYIQRGRKQSMMCDLDEDVAASAMDAAVDDDEPMLSVLLS